jgi:tetratricopeptide (TPR) repeat protein
MNYSKWADSKWVEDEEDTGAAKKKDGGKVSNLRFGDAQDPNHSKTKWEQVADAELCKEKATALFKAGDLKGAFAEYSKAVGIIDAAIEEEAKEYDWDDFSDDEDEKQKKDHRPKMDPRSQRVMVSCSLNAALCAFRLKDFAACVRYASVAVYVEPENVKGLFRRGKGNTALAEYKRAKEDLLKAKTLDPDNREVIRALHALAGKKLEDKGKAKQKFGGAFDRVSMYTDKDGVDVIQRKKQEEEATQKQADKAEAAEAKAKAAEADRRREEARQEATLASAQNNDWKYVVCFYAVVGIVFTLRFGLGFRFFGLLDMAASLVGK